MENKSKKQVVARDKRVKLLKQLIARGEYRCCSQELARAIVRNVEDIEAVFGLAS